MPSDPCGGVKCFSIGGRVAERRQRCLGMTDEERRWRAQWLKDQVLTPEEPRYVPELYKSTTNFIRRLWKTPMYKFQHFLEPLLGVDKAFLIRHAVGKFCIGVSLLYILTYYFKYQTNDFTRYRSVEVYAVRPRMYPYNPDYPNYPVKTNIEYCDQGFYSSVLCQDVEKIPPEKISEPSAPPPSEKEIIPTTPCPLPVEE